MSVAAGLHLVPSSQEEDQADACFHVSIRPTLCVITLEVNSDRNVSFFFLRCYSR